MKKIKKFKVNLRKREILRNLKLISEVKEITPQIEEIVESEIKKSADYVTPASVYSSYTHDEMLVKFGPDFLHSEGRKPPGATFIIVTAGKMIEDEIKTRQAGGETIHAAIIRALGLEAVDGALNFVVKLALNEAKSEDSILLTPEKIDGKKAAQALEALEAKKIGVSIDENGRVQPEFSSVVAVRWK